MYKIIISCLLLLVLNASAHLVNTNPPPLPASSIAPHKLKPTGVESDSTSPTLDLFGLDYWGPITAVTNGGDAAFTTIWTNSGCCFSNFCGVQNLTSNQTAWFQLQMTPNRDLTNVHGARFSFRLGLLGASGDLVTCYYWRLGAATNWTVLNQINGTGVGSGLAQGTYPLITNWQAFSWYYPYTNDVLLRFTYATGANTGHYPNAAGVDYFCWEPDVIDTNHQPWIRAEYEMANTGPFGQLADVCNAQQHSIRISWPYFGGYSGVVVTNNYNLYTSTNVTGPWVSIQQYPSPPGRHLIVYTDPTGTRAVTYYDYTNFVPVMFFKLLPNP